MTKAAKQWSPGELEALEVGPAVSTDETRQHMCKPFGREMKGRGFIVGTDGHRLHAVQCEAWKAFERPNAPRAECVIPWFSTRLGEINVPGLEEARVFPARWDVSIEIQPQIMLCHMRVPKGSGKKASHVYPFGRGGVRVDWFKLDQLTIAIGVHLPYLLDAVDFIGTGLVIAWGSKADPLAPIVITAPGVKDLAEAKRIAVVMPCRI